MRYFSIVLLPCVLLLCSCRNYELEQEIADLHAALNTARAEAEVAKAELQALKSADGAAKQALNGAAAELAKKIPGVELPLNPTLRAQLEQARAAYEGTTPAPAPVTPPTDEEQVLEFGKSF